MTSKPTIRRLVHLLLALATCSVLLAACGSDGRLSKNEYIDRMNALQTKASKAIEKTTGATPGAEDVAGVTRELDAAIADIKKLKPPEEWQKYHDDIVESLETTRDATLAIQKAKPGDVKAATAQLTKIKQAQEQYNSAINGINKDR